MSAATSYAKALYAAAQEWKAVQGSVPGSELPSHEDLEKDMDLLQEVLSASKEMRVALLGPITTSREKASLVEELCKRLKMPPLSIRFAVLLAKKRRLELLSNIRDAFSTIRLTAEGSVAGRLVSASQMSEQETDSLAKAFGKKLGKKVAFRVSIDPSLLAGMKVTVNGVTYDGTLRSQLQKLRDSFAAGVSSAHA